MNKLFISIVAGLTVTVLSITGAFAAATCGTDNGKTLSSPPTNLCAAGNPSPVIDSGATWDWVCIDTVNPSIVASCNATKAAAPNGICGPAHGGTFDSLSATDSRLCQAGNVNNFSGTGPCTWRCSVAGGGTSFCQAGKTGLPPPPPIAGPYNVDARGIGIKYTNISDVLSFVVKLIISLCGLGFMAMLLFGAFKYVTSQGDKMGVAAAQGILTNAVIGLALAAGLFAIMTLLQNVLGISLLNITI